ncbi:hypothetical protein EHM92_09845, partial [bacterium]
MGTFKNHSEKPSMAKTTLALLLILTLVPAVYGQRTKLEPGWNLFSAQQDVEMGQQVAADAERKLPIIKDNRINGYLNRLGQKLASHAPGPKYPYQFKGVNDPSINAFALPGGFLYINRGTIEAADNEAQLAGVIAHEISHVALRHGTNQASKAYIAQVPLAILGGVAGDSVAGVLAQIGGGFAANSVLLKYSRDAERQADLMGAQILHDAGYDPRAMSQFFQKLQSSGQRSGMPQWLSSHPNPENRIGEIEEEIGRLGDSRRGIAQDSREFRSIKNLASSLPGPRATGTAQQNGVRSKSGERPAPPSRRLRYFSNDFLNLRYPDNWNSNRSDGGSLMLAPDNGIVSDGQSNALAYGMMIGIAQDTGQDLRSATSDL